MVLVMVVMVVMVVTIFTQDLRTLMFKIIIMARLMLKSFGGCTVDQREGRRSGGKGAQMRPRFSCFIHHPQHLKNQQTKYQIAFCTL